MLADQVQKKRKMIKLTESCVNEYVQQLTGLIFLMIVPITQIFDMNIFINYNLKCSPH